MAVIKGVGSGGEEGAEEGREGLSVSRFHKRGGEEYVLLGGFMMVLTEHLNKEGLLGGF